MLNKLKVLSLGALIAATLGLAACDDVEAKLPEAEQSNPIVQLSTEIVHNDIETLFEDVVPGNSSTASKVLDELLFRIAKAYFGDFYTEIRPIIANDAKIKAFVDTHARFQLSPRDKDAEVLRFKDFYNHLLESIEKSFWGNVTNSTYQDRNFFVEKKFYDAQVAAMYKLDANYGVILEGNDNRHPIVGEFDHTHTSDYFGTANANGDYLDVYKDYIERSLLPNLYRTTLVENYLTRKNYSALGRSHARKVQTITLKNLDTADATRNLITHYVEDILAATDDEIRELVHTGDDTIAVASVTAKDIESLRDLHFISEVYQGFINLDGWMTPVQKAAAKYLYAKSNWESMTADLDEDPATDDVTFYPLTTLGDIYKSYTELSNVRWETGSSTDFTGGGAYTKETGLMLKEREVLAKTNVTEGWFSSSELSSLPSDLRSRLFKIQVANDVDNNDEANEKMDFGWYVNGSYYLNPETYSSSSDHPYLYFDSSSSSWVIVRVDEAVKSAKLSSSEASYDAMAKAGKRAGKETQNQIVNKVTAMLADNDSYTKAAKQEAVEEANLVYHDQNVYDYFKSNFPDLFD